MQITSLPPLEVEAPVGPRRPFGLYSQINWLSPTDILGIMRDKPEGTATDPAPNSDQVDSGTTENGAVDAMGFNPQSVRWESGIYTHPLGFLPNDDFTDLDNTTDIELKNDDWDTVKHVNQGLPPAQTFTAWTVIWKERRSSFEMTEDEQVRRAKLTMDMVAERQLEDRLYQALLIDPSLDNLTTAGDSDPTAYPSVPSMIADLESNWVELGVPTLHLPFWSYPFLSPDRLLIDGQGPGGKAAKFTAGGTPVILGIGNPNMVSVESSSPVAAATGCVVGMMTGPVFGFQNPEDAVLIDYEEHASQRSNDRVITIERTFVVGWNSYRAFLATANTDDII